MKLFGIILKKHNFPSCVNHLYTNIYLTKFFSLCYAEKTANHKLCYDFLIGQFGSNYNQTTFPTGGSLSGVLVVCRINIVLLPFLNLGLGAPFLTKNVSQSPLLSESEKGLELQISRCLLSHIFK